MSSLVINFKKTHKDAKTPSYAYPMDAGLDVYALSITEETANYTEYDTGVALELPEGYVALAFPRSSISKYSQSLANSVGVIDAGFRESVKFRFRKYAEGNNVCYKQGDKIGQLIIIPFPKVNLIEVAALNDTIRGGKGTGSSGR